MSVIKLLVISAITALLSMCSQNHVETPTETRNYTSSSTLANQDKALEFVVPEDGQMMRFEITGVMTMNSWKAIEIEVFDSNERYLFTYQDELWAENGRDSDGAWTEYRKYASMEQRFPKSGSYFAYITDSSGPYNRAKTVPYKLRVIPIRGNGSILAFIKWLSVVIAGVCLVILFSRFEERENDIVYRPINLMPKSKAERKKDLKVFALFWLIFLTPVAVANIFAYQQDDDDIDWLSVAQWRKSIYVDRDLRQQSLSGANFRTRGAVSGK